MKVGEKSLACKHPRHSAIRPNVYVDRLNGNDLKPRPSDFTKVFIGRRNQTSRVVCMSCLVYGHGIHGLEPLFISFTNPDSFVDHWKPYFLKLSHEPPKGSVARLRHNSALAFVTLTVSMFPYPYISLEEHLSRITLGMYDVPSLPNDKAYGGVTPDDVTNTNWPVEDYPTPPPHIEENTSPLKSTIARIPAVPWKSRGGGQPDSWYQDKFKLLVLKLMAAHRERPRVWSVVYRQAAKLAAERASVMRKHMLGLDRAWELLSSKSRELEELMVKVEKLKDTDSDRYKAWVKSISCSVKELDVLYSEWERRERLRRNLGALSSEGRMLSLEVRRSIASGSSLD